MVFGSDVPAPFFAVGAFFLAPSIPEMQGLLSRTAASVSLETRRCWEESLERGDTAQGLAGGSPGESRRPWCSAGSSHAFIAAEVFPLLMSQIGFAVK